MRSVILEGCDGSGKSTLSRSLTYFLDMRVQEGQGPGKDQNELNVRVNQYLHMTNTIFDRHPIISQPIYNQFRTGAPKIEEHHLKKFAETRSQYIIVYCEGASYYHRPKYEETAEQLELVKNHYEDLLHAYREWALGNADIIYRIRQDMTLICRMIKGGL